MEARRAVCSALTLCALLLIGCGEDDDPRSPGVGSPGVAGTSMGSAQSLDGSWVITSDPENRNCGPLNALFETVTVMTIVQAGNDFNFTMVDNCGTSIPGGTGSIDPGGTVRFGTEASRSLTSTCRVLLSEDWTGFAQIPTDEFNGSNVLSIVNSHQPGQDDCGQSVPCTVSGSFIAERCPRSGCNVTCTP
ncbi:MAG TPA: hypothetical protein VFD06_00245 [Candidatus Polarisedimenticolia bacterium]|nr:hypothetical protein [Candidatus Polarisedimenticolia bacterium]